MPSTFKPSCWDGNSFSVALTEQEYRARCQETTREQVAALLESEAYLERCSATKSHTKLSYQNHWRMGLSFLGVIGCLVIWRSAYSPSGAASQARHQLESQLVDMEAEMASVRDLIAVKTAPLEDNLDWLACNAELQQTNIEVSLLQTQLHSDKEALSLAQFQLARQQEENAELQHHLSQQSAHAENLEREVSVARSSLLRTADHEAANLGAHLVAWLVLAAELLVSYLVARHARQVSKKACTDVAVQAGTSQLVLQDRDEVECQTPAKPQRLFSDSDFLPHDTVEQRYMLRLQQEMDRLQQELRERENRLAQQNELMNIVQQEIMDTTEAEHQTRRMNAQLKKEIQALRHELDYLKQQNSCSSWSKYPDMASPDTCTLPPPPPTALHSAPVHLSLHTPLNEAAARKPLSPRSPFSEESSVYSSGTHAHASGTLHGSTSSVRGSVTGNKENAASVSAAGAAAAGGAALKAVPKGPPAYDAAASPSDLNAHSRSELVALDFRSSDMQSR